MVFIKKGSVSLYRHDKLGNEVLIAKEKEGEVLGCMTIFERTARTASAVADTDVEVRIVSREQLNRLMGKVEPWVKTLLKDLINRVSEASENYVSMYSILNGKY